VQNDHAFLVATHYWATHLGCAPESLFALPLNIVTHGPDLSDYNGIFAIFRDGTAMVSFPPERIDELRELLPTSPVAAERFAETFNRAGYTVIGPAYIGYAAAVLPPIHAVSSLTQSDAPAVRDLQAACPAIEWEHGGGAVGEHPSSGVFVGSQLVALAGYEIWGGKIAHISVVTHPTFRGRGFGRSAVAHLSNTALAAGLTPQYRTLESNRPSIRIAESLGFSLYATSVAVRLNNAD
jgi:GNAT superfamily N-acetyltransferase